MEINQDYFISFDENEFVLTPFLRNIMDRALVYARAGIPVNFSGTSGIGKTTLALYMAFKLGRPVILIHGNDELKPSDLIGGNYGYQKKKKIDNYIHSVYMSEENLKYHWINGQISRACIEGYTVIYDEFTRSRPETNNLFLAVLEEGVLSLTGWQEEKQYLKVAPEFKIIFTSNPEEYAGVHKSQVALKDRMITIELENIDMQTEIEIVHKKTSLDMNKVKRIVNIVRDFRNNSPVRGTSIRSSIKLARVIMAGQIEMNLDNSQFCEVCRDVLFSDLQWASNEQKVKINGLLEAILGK